MLRSDSLLPKKCYLQVPGMDNATEEAQGWPQDDAVSDKYTAAIELSNKCRDFYKSRVEAANIMKSKWRHSVSDSESASSSASTSPTSSTSSISQSQEDENVSRGHKSGVDAAMERLRAEMVSLIDQDLSLMKQLLTLNETIEELKWQRQYYSCSTSCTSLSNSKLLESNWSVSDTEMYEAEDDLMAVNHLTSGTAQTGMVTGPTWHSTRKTRKATKDLDNGSMDNAAPLLDIIVDVSVDNCGQHERVADSPEDISVCSESLDSLGHMKYMKNKYRSHLDPCTNEQSGQSIIHHDREQNSFDSGIHEDLVWTV
ncbi:hypothetical protein BgiMline_013296 [Biomphalaria glabrata]|uniref:Uncharacterized protein LOC106066060 n=1 Tax=Biomphalaria glabrata TaxID=6526 RepID=A0A9U8EBE1_BIOGL|nr:uncharacterized protein LOC106066060 [Biomphalaria glabrata]KAI8750150.1 hypothetical protein BgiMline_017100 [Biomphalaria glabrata]